MAKKSDPVSETLAILGEIDGTLSRRAITGDRMPTGGLWGRFFGASGLVVGYVLVKFYPFLGPIAFPAILAVLGTTFGNLYWRLKVHGAEVHLEKLRSGIRLLESDAKRCLAAGAPPEAREAWWESFHVLVSAVKNVAPQLKQSLPKKELVARATRRGALPDKT